MRSWCGSRRSRARREARAINFRQKNTCFRQLFFEILPVGQISSLYALVESSLSHRNLLNSSLALDAPRSTPGEPRAHPREQKEFKIMPKETRNLPRGPQYIYIYIHKNSRSTAQAADMLFWLRMSQTHAALRSFILTFEDGHIRTIWEPWKHQTRAKT